MHTFVVFYDTVLNKVSRLKIKGAHDLVPHFHKLGGFTRDRF